MKIYKSSTVIHMTAYVDGHPRRVNFDDTMRGQGMYVTGDEKLQAAIEAHPWFGQRFRLASTLNPEPEAAKPVEEKKNTEVKVSDIASAQEYLADKFGVSRSKIRTRKAIEDFASANGITIKW